MEEKQWKTKTRLYRKVPVPKPFALSWADELRAPGLFDIDLFPVSSLVSIPSVRSIRHEYDEQSSRAVKALLAERKALFKEHLTFLSLVSRRNYSRLVKAFSYYVTKPVWDGKSWEIVRIPNYEWTPHEVTEIIPYVKALHRKILGKGSPRMKARWSRELRWLDSHPEDPRHAQTIIWHIRTEWTKKVVTVSVVRRKVRTRQRVRITNWQRVNRRWAQLLDSYHKKSQKVYDRLKIVRERLNALTSSIRKEYNAMQALKLDGLRIRRQDRIRGRVNRLLPISGDYSIRVPWIETFHPSALIEGSVFNWPFACTSALQEHYWATSEVCTLEIRRGVTPMSYPQVSTAEEFRKDLLQAWDPSQGQFEIESQNTWDGFPVCLNYRFVCLAQKRNGSDPDWIDDYSITAGFGDYWKKQYAYADWINSAHTVVATSDRNHTPPARLVNCDSWDYQRFLQELSDKTSVLRAGLYNLNLKRDEISFNLARSIGELKDTPQTIRTGADFLRFMRGYPSNVGNEVRVTLTNGHKVSYYTKGRLPDWVKNLVVTGSSPRAKSFKVCRVPRVSTLGILAKVYLAWKFAVQPTMSDINQLRRLGLAAAACARRTLVRATRNLKEHSHKTMFRTARVLPPGSPLPSYRNGQIVVPYEGRQTDPHGEPIGDRVLVTNSVSYAFSDLDYRAFIDRVALRQLMEKQSITIYYGDDSTECRLPTMILSDGSWVIHPAVHSWEHLREGYLAAASSSPGLVLRALAERSTEKSAMSSWSEEYEVLVRQQSFLKLFAAFSADELHKVVASDSWESGSWMKTLLVRTHLVQTAWELAPLSFVVDWVTNMQDRIQTLNNQIEAIVTKVRPSSAPWRRLATELWCAVSRLQQEFVPGSVKLSLNGVTRLTVRKQDWGIPIPYPNRQMTSRQICQMELPESFTISWKTLNTSAPVVSDYRRILRTVYRSALIGGWLTKPPPLRLRLNLNAGKVGTLLAMFTK